MENRRVENRLLAAMLVGGLGTVLGLLAFTPPTSFSWNPAVGWHADFAT